MVESREEAAEVGAIDPEKEEEGSMEEEEDSKVLGDGVGEAIDVIEVGVGVGVVEVLGSSIVGGNVEPPKVQTPFEPNGIYARFQKGNGVRGNALTLGPR